MRRIILLVIWGLAQILLLTLLIIFPLTDISFLVYILISLTGILLALVIISDDTKLSTSKYSWIIIILALPIAGIVLYLIFGHGYMTSYRKHVLENSKLKYFDSNIYEVPSSILTVQEVGMVKYLDNMNYRTSSLTYGGDISSFMYGEQLFDKMIKDFENAKTYIHIESYIIKPGELFDRVAEVLKKQAKKGVQVRVLTDFFGGYSLPADQVEDLRKHHVEVVLFNEIKFKAVTKIFNFRDHRKMVVIDGKIAYTGGFNIGDEYIDKSEYYKHWQDFHIRIENSPAVLDYETYFAQMWFFETKHNLMKEEYYPEYQLDDVNKETFIYTYVDGPDSEETFVRDMFLKLIMSARKSLYISTPYFIPDDVIFDALIVQAYSGVDIHLITPGLPDKKYVKLVTESYYPELLKAGIKIHEYNGFVHAKKFLADDSYAIVGTANLDMRSFNLSFEVCTFLAQGNIIKDIKNAFEFEINDSKEIKASKRQVSFTKKILKVLLRLMSPMF